MDDVSSVEASVNSTSMDVAGWLDANSYQVSDVVLVGHPGAPAPPMDMPVGVDRYTVEGVHLKDNDPRRVTEFVVGPESVDADRVEGAVSLRLVAGPSQDRVKVECWVALGEDSLLVGVWPQMGRSWPLVVGVTAAAVMGLQDAVSHR